MLLITLIIFCGMVTRLVYIQIVNTDEFKLQAENKSTAEIDEPAPRGDIMDSSGNKLATTEQSYTLTYTESDESKYYFYQTMDEVIDILQKNKDNQKDDLELKINPFAFKFKGVDENSSKQLELRFKKDRGLDAEIQKKLFPNKKDALTDEENAKINDALLKITPQETYNNMVKLYDITPEGIFRSYANLYKTDSKAALQIIEKDYKITSVDEVTALLDNYKKGDKHAKDYFNELLQKCNVKDKTLTLEQQRKYMLVKDAVRQQSFSKSKPVTIAVNIQKTTVFSISQELNDLPGINVTIQPMRYYPYDQLGASFIGYMSKISADKKDSYEEKGYDASTDYVGIAGIEGAFEDLLKGSKGAEVAKINSVGRVTEELGEKEPYSGDTIQLTINSDVQYAAQTALDKTMKELQANPNKIRDVNTSNATRGAAVAIDVNTGGVLALASYPTFNPNDFVSPSGLTDEQDKKYFHIDLAAYGRSRGFSDEKINTVFPVDKITGARTDPYDIVPKPLYNYAALSLTPPGSTFKPLTAVTGLETGAITAADTVDDEGYFEDKSNNFYAPFKADGANHTVNVVKALVRSSNPFFMTVGQRLLRYYPNQDKLAQYAWKFGLGVDPKSATKASSGIEISENYGQTYNKYSLANVCAQNYLYTAMDTLKSGKGYDGDGRTFTPIELHMNGNEDDDIISIRKKIRDQIQTSIKTGDRANATYTSLLKQLIKIDPLYKDKKISDSDIATIVYEIGRVAVDTGYYEVNSAAAMYNASIGQGMNTFTPIQLANYIATIANGGKRYRVHLVDKIIDTDNNVISETKPEIMENTGVSQQTLDIVKQGMHGVVADDNGTASKAFENFKIDTAGKTGSATYNEKTQDSLGRTSYGVYVGFAPYENPKIAVAVVVFDGGHGSSVAEVAKAMYEAYFKKELAEQNYQFTYDVNAKALK